MDVKNNSKDQNVGEIQDAWFKEYLLREQQIKHDERMKLQEERIKQQEERMKQQEERMRQQEETMRQQEALLNITQTLLKNMKQLP